MARGVLNLGNGRASCVSNTAEDHPPSTSAWLGSSWPNYIQYSREWMRYQSLSGTLWSRRPRFTRAGGCKQRCRTPSEAVGATHWLQEKHWQDQPFENATRAGTVGVGAAAIGTAVFARNHRSELRGLSAIPNEGTTQDSTPEFNLQYTFMPEVHRTCKLDFCRAKVQRG